jgi:two-component system response regulator HydG
MPDAMRIVPQIEPVPSYKYSLLVVDDDPASRIVCKQVAESSGYLVQMTESASGLLRLLASRSLDAVVLDLRVASLENVDLVRKIKDQSPETEVIVSSASPTVESVLAAIKSGALDYLPKPFNGEEFRLLLQRLSARLQNSLEERKSRERLMTNPGYAGLFGQSAEMQKLFRIVAKVASSTHPVLVLGESGTGRERMARTIHDEGPAHERPFVAIDCSAPPAVVESELFACVKGTSTGPKAKAGSLVLASGGTIFLDEIGELPLELQGKFMRVLQEKEIRLSVGVKPVPMDVRVIASTHRDLELCAQHGTFRRDLFFRLNVVSLRIPPLRERKDDVRLLADHVLANISKVKGVRYSLSAEAVKVLLKYDWPGNVRELENCLERAVAMSSGPVLSAADLPAQVRAVTFQPRLELATSERPAIVPLAEVEKQAILDTLERLKGDKLMTARMLGIGKTTLYRKLKEYGIGDVWLTRQAVNK